jgi:L-iditol 2-dehydrogenase
MKAIVKYKKGDGFVELREVVEPIVDSESVTIKVKAAGICGTDIHILDDEFKYSAPVIMGHEFSGEIVEIGEKVEEWKVRERVVSEPHTGACRVCQLCRTGNPQICSKKRPIGSGQNGAFAEFIKVPSWLLHRIPEGVSFEEAALAEPTAICVHCILEKTGIETGDFVAILGPGPIGLLAVQVAKNAGASCVLMTGTSKDVNPRLKIAGELGVDYILNVDKEDPVSKVRQLTNDTGADVVVEASGSPLAINQAFQMVRRGGRISALGMTKKGKVEISWNVGIMKGIQITLPFSSGYTSWEKALGLIASKKINVASLITQRFPLKDWSEAFSLIKEGQAIKILLIP